MDDVGHAVTPQTTPDRQTLVVASVDVIAIATLILIGQLDHGLDPIATPLAAIETMVPFVLGWLVVGILAGAYRPGPYHIPTRAAVVTTVGWLGGANVGLLLRSSPLFDGGTQWPFNLVITGLGLVVLCGWRLGYASIFSSKSNSET